MSCWYCCLVVSFIGHGDCLFGLTFLVGLGVWTLILDLNFGFGVY